MASAKTNRSQFCHQAPFKYPLAGWEKLKTFFRVMDNWFMLQLDFLEVTDLTL